ncbi:MAG: hypothetical protein LKI17_00950 [Megasphaera cerevisiae]|jgi:hypothetical protein|nr:hypothetical protein [Megasphaera cerevisiae]
MMSVSYGIPLAISLAGTVGSLAVDSKKAHIVFGAVMTGIALLHGFQHKKVMLQQMKNSIGFTADYARIPHTRPDFFLRGVDVAFYMPGRIRLYCRTLQGNEKYEERISKYLQPISQMGHIEMNHLSGSILITYNAKQLRKNADLARVERYIKGKARICTAPILV